MMQFQQNQSVILLIGNDLNILENMIYALEAAGNKIITACDGCEGFLQAQRKHPDLTVSQMSLDDVSGVELCRLIRSDEDLCATPFVLMGETLVDGGDAAEIFLADADDYLSPFHDANYLAAKVDWLIKRKRSDENLRQYYKILRRRQVHITEIIKETSDLMRSFNDEPECTPFSEFSASETEKLFGKKIELGINMVDSLAHLLEEQVNALEICERTQKGEELSILPELCGEKYEYDYYEIIS